MSLRTYTLAVCLVSVLGLLLSLVPAVRNTFEYLSPTVRTDEPKELSSLETYATQHANESEIRLMVSNRGGWYSRFGEGHQAMYDAAKAQHAAAVQQEINVARRKARQNIIAYGALGLLSLALFLSHLIWARRLH